MSQSKRLSQSIKNLAQSIKAPYKYLQFLLVAFGLVTAVHAQAADLKFFSGSNIENKDDKSYILNYSFPARTKVCFILKSTPEIKHSLPATLNRDVAGLTIIKREFDGEEAKIKATIAGKTRIYCLCTDECEITVGELGKKTLGHGKTLVIEKGVLTVQ